MAMIGRLSVVLLLIGALVLPGTSSASPRCRAIKKTVQVSKVGGLGRIEWTTNLGAVLQRDEGIVSILEPRGYHDPPRVVGRYDDGATRSFDGDLAFVDDRWLLYARQTHQFSKDGIHVLDLADPTAPRLAFYQPQGGTLRIAHYSDGATSWVFSLDAIHGLITNRFEPTTGALVPVHASPLPALKVGGPASAGLFIDRKDPMTGAPVLYASTGRTGVEMFDISNPVDPVLLGSWGEVGLAEIEVDVSKKKRTIYGATEYWFDKQLPPEVIVLDATDPAAIKESARWSLKAPADDRARVQGMTLSGDLLYVAHSRVGIIAFNSRGHAVRQIHLKGDVLDGSAYAAAGGPMAFDVETYPWGDFLFSDAATGRLTFYSRSCHEQIFVLEIESTEG